jgi:hypothetical protein
MVSGQWSTRARELLAFFGMRDWVAVSDRELAAKLGLVVEEADEAVSGWS